jgi:hypothetical protein
VPVQTPFAAGINQPKSLSLRDAALRKLLLS